MLRKKIIIFTDLDGTLLDHYTYSYVPAKETLKLIKSKKIPLIFCSSKTKTEQEFYQDELKIRDPFIVENGGAIYIRKGYFNFPYKYQKSVADYNVIELGIPYEKVRRILAQLKDETQFVFKGYGDMDVNEIINETGLERELAKRSKEREYTEPLKLVNFSKNKLNHFEKAIKEKGLNYVYGGRFCTVMGPNDKGKAVSILINLYKQAYGSVQSIGIGDAENDIPLLSVVDIPILVQKPGGAWEKMDLANLWKVKCIGPAGWNKAILKLLKNK